MLPGKKPSKNLQQLTREKGDSHVRHVKMFGTMYYGADNQNMKCFLSAFNSRLRNHITNNIIPRFTSRLLRADGMNIPLSRNFPQV